MIISKIEAAELLGISPGAVSQWKDKDFFVIYDGKTQIDTEHPAWKKLLIKRQNKATDKKRSDSMHRRQAIKNAWQPEEDDPPRRNIDEVKPPEDMTPEVSDLAQQAAIAGFQDIIFTARIREEKAKQEEIKTLEIKKDLANVDLIIHFFSFTENLIQRWYRRPHEISPQLSTLYLAGEDKKAVQLLLRELEGIVKETQNDLIKEIENEGLKIKDEYFRPTD